MIASLAKTCKKQSLALSLESWLIWQQFYRRLLLAGHCPKVRDVWGDTHLTGECARRDTSPRFGLVSEAKGIGRGWDFADPDLVF